MLHNILQQPQPSVKTHLQNATRHKRAPLHNRAYYGCKLNKKNQ